MSIYDNEDLAVMAESWSQKEEEAVERLLTLGHDDGCELLVGRTTVKVLVDVVTVLKALIREAREAKEDRCHANVNL